MRTRRAVLPDAEAIHALIANYSGDGTLLPRSLNEVCENVRDFTVVVDHGTIVACGALHLYGAHLTEIRSICVLPERKGKGAGAMLVDALLREARHHKTDCVCLFTRIPEFFARFGFRMATREELPDKMYKDCLNCPRLHACDEVAMVRGELPTRAVLGDIPIFIAPPAHPTA
jgi:amino-acid N-acetyltransferase